MKLTLITFLLIALMFSLCKSRIFQTSMKLSNIGINKGWLYLDKMSFAPGTVTISVMMITSGIAYGTDGSVTIEAIPEHLWQKQRASKCQKSPVEPFIDHKVYISTQAQNYSTHKQWNIQQTTLYYFVLKDCTQSLKAEYQNSNLDMLIQLHMRNNSSQLGEQQDHWYIIPVIFIAGTCLFFLYRNSIKSANIKEELHKYVMFVGSATQVSSLTWKTFGYLLYVYTGFDYGFFHFVYLFMYSMSESLVIGLVMMIGFGWTINFVTSDNWNLYLPIGMLFTYILAGVFALANAVLTLMTKFITNVHDRHHIFDNISGTIMIAYRVLFVVIFIGGVIYTYQTSKARVKRFIVLFGILGSLYIASLPLIIFIGDSFISAKDRHQFVFVAIQALKCLTNIGMSLMLNLEKSEYNEISYKNRSFVPEESKYF